MCIGTLGALHLFSISVNVNDSLNYTIFPLCISPLDITLVEERREAVFHIG